MTDITATAKRVAHDTTNSRTTVELELKEGNKTHSVVVEVPPAAINTLLAKSITDDILNGTSTPCRSFKEFHTALLGIDPHHPHALDAVDALEQDLACWMFHDRYFTGTSQQPMTSLQEDSLFGAFQSGVRELRSQMRGATLPAGLAAFNAIGLIKSGIVDIDDDGDYFLDVEVSLYPECATNTDRYRFGFVYQHNLTTEQRAVLDAAIGK